MAQDDKGLALRDSSTVSPPRVLPTVTSGSVRALLMGLEHLGHDRPSLLAAGGLREADLTDPDVEFPCTIYPAILSHALRTQPIPNLALKVASVTPIGAYPIVDYLIVTADTVGEGLTQLARYFRLVGAPLSVDIHHMDDSVRVTVDSPFNQFGAEYTVALAVFHMRDETHGRFKVSHMSFTHRLDDRTEFERTFACPVSEEAPWTGVVVPRLHWDLQLRRRDPALRGLLERHANDRLARLSKGDNLVVMVRRMLAWRIDGRDTRVGAVARQFGMTSRTLQRRLAEAGLSYQQLVEQSRQQSAKDHLMASALSIGEIGFLLGYSATPTFHRAFKRWTGLTPREFRARHRTEKT